MSALAQAAAYANSDAFRTELKELGSDVTSGGTVVVVLNGDVVVEAAKV